MPVSVPPNVPKLDHRIPTTYNHEQTVPSEEWTIIHNLKGYPIVDAYTMYEDDLQRILPIEVTYVDQDTCTLTFSQPRAGFATVV